MGEEEEGSVERERRGENMEKERNKEKKRREEGIGGNEALIFARSYNTLNENLRANTLAGANQKSRERERNNKNNKKRA